MLKGYKIVYTASDYTLNEKTLEKKYFNSQKTEIVIFLPAAYFLGKTGDVGNVWWCFLIAEFMSVGMSIFYTYRIYRKRISLLPLE